MAKEWFRLYADFAISPKIQMLSEADQRRYIMLMCMACDSKDGSITDKLVSFRLRISHEETMRTKQTLTEAGLIIGDWSLSTSLRTDAGRPLAHVWNEIRSRIFKRDDYTCRYCGERGKKLECDHVVPVSRGGGHDDSNLVTSCFACNRSKRDKLVEEWQVQA